MPCKPAEYDVTRQDGERAEARVRDALRHRAQLRRLLRAFLHGSGGGIPPALREQAEVLASDEPAALQPRPEDAAPGHYTYPAHGSWGLELLYRADREERWLCEARTLMLRIAKHCAPPAAERATFEQQLAEHRCHRAEDLEAVREALRVSLRNLRVTDPNSSAAASRLREQQARAASLTVDDILDDRAILETLWPGR